MQESYLVYTHNNPTEDTIGKFFNKNKSVVEGQDMIDFLKLRGFNGDININSIFSKYDSLQRDKYNDLCYLIANGERSILPIDEVKDLPLNTSTVLSLPKDSTKIELIAVKGKNLFLEQKEFQYFYPDKLKKLMDDPNYIRAENLSKHKGVGFDIEVMMENCQVWLWSRALNKIVDVSPFITSLTTEKSDVGQFSFNLSPVKNIEELTSVQSNNVINYFFLNNKGKHDFEFFYKNFQYNDLVFIRFEKLKIDENLKTNAYNFEVDKTNLPGQVWDMIGLVDTCSVNQSYGISTSDTTVTGRDFMKLLIEDGSYFMNIALLQAEGKQQLVYGWQPDSKWFRRQFDSGKIGGKYSPYFFPNAARTIEDTMGFIVNQLSNLGVLEGEDLFSAYRDRRSTQYIVEENSKDPETLGETTLESDFVQGVWQIIKLMSDSSLSERRVVDTSISFVDGTIVDQFNKLCQMPFVEFFGDTYGDEFNIVARQPPFNKDMIVSFLNGIENSERLSETEGKNYQMIDIEEKDLQGYGNLQFDNTFYSWYQLTPNDTMIGAYTSLMVGNLIPIIAFSRIAECFGNKRLVIPDNYLSVNIVEGSESAMDINYYRRALLNDLKYVIDTNVYLPFTRRGTLTLTRGDRRIKKGMFIRVKPTNEIFYVDSVSNSLAFSQDKVERSTTIQVSRGMIEDYIYGANGYEADGAVIKNVGEPEKFSYFDIAKTVIDTKTSHKVSSNQNSGEQNPTTGFLSINSSTEYYRALVSENFPTGEVENALRVIMAESKGNPLAIRPEYLNRGGGSDSGLFQINSKYHPEAYENGNMLVAEDNIIEAARIWKQRGWGEWSTASQPGVITNGNAVEITTHYSVQLGHKIEDAFNKNNPGNLVNSISKSTLSYTSKEIGFDMLLSKVKEAQDSGWTIETFMESNVQAFLGWTSHFYLLKTKLGMMGYSGVAETTVMSSIPADDFSIAYSYVETGSVVVKSLTERIINTQNSLNNVNKISTVFDDNFDFSLVDVQFDFFLHRKQLNIYKYGRRD